MQCVPLALALATASRVAGLPFLGHHVFSKKVKKPSKNGAILRGELVGIIGIISSSCRFRDQKTGFLEARP